MTTTVRVMALHALTYCERLFYLEEVEGIYVADAAVFAGRTLHEELAEDETVTDLTLESEELGLRGRVDAVRRRDGSVYPVEHKRGRARRGDKKQPEAWDTDRIQVGAYAMLLAAADHGPMGVGRIRYHADAVTVRVPLDDALRADVHAAVARARHLARTTERPPVTTDERRCVRCSLAPVCLPEEARLAQAERTGTDKPTPVRLFPPDLEQRSLHVVTQGARVGRSGEELVVNDGDQRIARVGLREVSDVVLHGFAQITTQALRACGDAAIPVHLVTTSGAWLGAFTGQTGRAQQRIRQYRALTDDVVALGLARTLQLGKVSMQLGLLLRASRSDKAVRDQVASQLDGIRAALRGVVRAASRAELMGHEGIAARHYFAALPHLVDAAVDPSFVPSGRSRRPPRDRFNALLSFGYALLFKDVHSAILRVGLEPGFGFLHAADSQAPPLTLDLQELFRVPMVDQAVLAAVNRRTFDAAADFRTAKDQVLLSDTGRSKLIEVYERRKHEEYRHPVLDYSLSYARMMELEVRLLEKEWSGESGLFARFRIR